MIYNIIYIVFTVFAVICGVAGLAAFICGIRMFAKENLNCTLRTEGLVIETLYEYDSQNWNDPDATQYNNMLCALRLRVELNGEELEVFNKQYSTDYCKYEEGDLVPIKINPNDPNEYVISDGTSSPGFFLLLVGLGMLAGCFFIVKAFWF